MLNKQVFNKQSEAETEKLENPENIPFFNGSSFRISEEEVSKAINTLKRNKSPGPDKLVSEFIISGKDLLLSSICNIFNLVFRTINYPTQWTKSFLKPLHKKGAQSNRDNYRGIAIGSCLGKLYSMVVLKRLEQELTLSRPISFNQIGFTKGKRTSDHIFVLKAIIDNTLKRKKAQVYAAFVDFQKAYDSVNRDLLFQKIYERGIHGLLYRNIKQMYLKTSYCIKLKSGFLNPIASNVGLKQGCPLSPLLFNIFIDDVSTIFNDNCDPVELHDIEINHLLYADDLVILSKSASGLAKSLENLDRYCENWHLKVNVQKTKVIIF